MPDPLVSLALVSRSLAGIFMCARDSPNMGSRENSLSATGNTTSLAPKASWTAAPISRGGEVFLHIEHFENNPLSEWITTKSCRVFGKSHICC